MNPINQNSDFLFLYEAIKCNPNGDPDQENKPRMDYDTKTNLVTDVRLKRYLRDYWKQNDIDIFVDMEGDSKVSADSKLKAEVNRALADAELLKALFEEAPDMKALFEKALEANEKAAAKKPETLFETLQAKDKKGKPFLQLNLHILDFLVKRRFVDIRLFGSAFAVAGFTRAYTGPVQINWGYSLHPVELMESNSLVTIMADDSSTFGKDYRVNYSLLAFHGTINKHQAKRTGMGNQDHEHLRNAMWNAIPALPSRSKQNQYPRLYVELVYNEGAANGILGDLRQYIKATPVQGKTYKEVRGFNDLQLDFSQLAAQIKAHKGPDKAIKEVIVKVAPGVSLDLDL